MAGTASLLQVASFHPRRDGTIYTLVASSPRYLSNHSSLTPLPGYFCPFAHRVNLVRYISGLTDIIGISIVAPYPKGNDAGWPGWKFPASDTEYPGATVDKLFGSDYLHKVYFKADPEYKGRYSVPVIWDKVTNTIVSNVRTASSKPAHCSFQVYE
jgi:putative glutathione S-transferase